MHALGVTYEVDQENNSPTLPRSFRYNRRRIEIGFVGAGRGVRHLSFLTVSPATTQVTGGALVGLFQGLFERENELEEGSRAHLTACVKGSLEAGLILGLLLTFSGCLACFFE